MTKIVVTNDQYMSSQQKQRLAELGEVTFYSSAPTSAEEYLQRVKGADIICSCDAGLKDAYPQLKNVYVTVFFVGVAFLDLEVLKKNNVMLSNAPGTNSYAVAEWALAMILLLTRDLRNYINREKQLRIKGNLPPLTPGLTGHKATILGHGNVGKRIGDLAAMFGMQVEYFKRGDDLYESVRDADVVIDALSSNPTTKNLLNEEFFRSMKQGAYFVTITRPEIVDEDAMLRALSEGHLAGAASDCGGILVGDIDAPYYQKLLHHPKVLVTPHIAYNAEISMKLGNDTMIDNVEAYLAGKPINLVVG